MAIQVQGQVGPQVGSDGNILVPRQGKSAELIVQELHGRYYEAAYRKAMFTAYCAAQATTVVGTGMVGLQVWNRNPAINLVLVNVGGDIIVTSASTTGLALAFGTGQVNAPTGQTAATSVINNYIGGAQPSALALAAGTFANAPVSNLILMHNTAAIAATGEDPGFFVELDGVFVVPPQCYVAIAALGATVAASGSNLHLIWEEVPI